MRTGKATGLQLAFLTFSVLLLTAPVSLYVGRRLELPAEWALVFERTAQLAVLAAMVFVAERFNRGLATRFLRPVPEERKVEVALVAGLKTLFPFAVFGAIMLSHWIGGDGAAVDRRFPLDIIHTADQEYSFSAPGLVLFIVGITLAPLIEEIVFRGLLYSAWEEAWGWVPAMVATSTLFGLFHQNFLSAFVSSVIFVCLYRRTGTLLAPMAVHAIGNACAWYGFGGQFYIPAPSLPAADLGTWWLHFIFLTAFAVAIPAYVAMARKAWMPRELP